MFCFPVAFCNSSAWPVWHAELLLHFYENKTFLLPKVSGCAIITWLRLSGGYNRLVAECNPERKPQVKRWKEAPWSSG